MARLLLTENGRQMWRTFTYLRVIWPDGRMSKAMEVEGTFLLTTGHEPETERVLELVLDKTPKRSLFHWKRDAMVFALGALAMAVYAATVVRY